MVLHMLKYLELNFPVLSDFGKIRNDAIIRSIIHFWGLLGSEWSKMVEYVANLGSCHCFEGINYCVTIQLYHFFSCEISAVLKVWTKPLLQPCSRHTGGCY